MTAPHLPTRTEQDLHADLVLRCVWLRAHAWEVDALDPSGQLAANLLDFADLIEVADREGWWDR